MPKSDAKLWSSIKLGELFDSQIKTLTERMDNRDQDTINNLKVQKSSVIKKATKMSSAQIIPFLPVIPRFCGYTRNQMPLVLYQGEQGRSHIDEYFLSDSVETPVVPYYIFDVDYGMSICDKEPQIAEEIISEQSRSPLTAYEVIALCVHTDVLSRHGIFALGSRYHSDDMLLYVYFGDGEEPALKWAFWGKDCDWAGYASCRSRNYFRK